MRVHPLIFAATLAVVSLFIFATASAAENPVASVEAKKTTSSAVADKKAARRNRGAEPLDARAAGREFAEPTAVLRAAVERAGGSRPKKLVVRLRNGDVWRGEVARTDEKQLWLRLRERGGTALIPLAWSRLVSVALEAEEREEARKKAAAAAARRPVAGAEPAGKAAEGKWEIVPRRRDGAGQWQVRPARGAARGKIVAKKKEKAVAREKQLLLLEAENAVLLRELERRRDDGLRVGRYLGPYYYDDSYGFYGYRWASLSPVYPVRYTPAYYPTYDYPTYRSYLGRSGGAYRFYGRYGRYGRGTGYATPYGWGMRYATRRGRTSFAFRVGGWGSRRGWGGWGGWSRSYVW